VYDQFKAHVTESTKRLAIKLKMLAKNNGNKMA